MKLFGFEITKAASAARPVVASGGRNLFHGAIHEANTGNWQRGIEWSNESVLSNPTLFRCINLIASDIGKLGLHLSSVDDDIWTRVENVAFSPVLRKPNPFQTRQQFIECWVHSKLTNGNTFVLKRRDARNVVIGLNILDSRRVTPLITPDGEVFYQLHHDDLAGVSTQGTTVPASEIIHDRFNCLFHPLIGLSPIMGAGLAAHSGLEIASNSARFFAQGARPGGILTAPNSIGEDTAKELKAYWEANFSGANSGKIAVVGDGLTYTPLSSNAVDAQLIEQLKWSSETVCSVFGVPHHLVGVGQAPTFNNIAALSQSYYSQCLQPYVTAIEDLLDEGLALPKPYHVEFELDDLIRLDEASLVVSLKEAVGAGILSPNEARARLNYAPVDGGSSPMAQQQNYSLAALAERDSDKPFAKPAPAPAPEPDLDTQPEDDDAEQEATKALLVIQKGLFHAV